MDIISLSEYDFYGIFEDNKGFTLVFKKLSNLDQKMNYKLVYCFVNSDINKTEDEIFGLNCISDEILANEPFENNSIFYMFNLE